MPRRQVNGQKVVAPKDIDKVTVFMNEYALSLTCAENTPFFSEGTKARAKALDVLVQVLKVKIDLRHGALTAATVSYSK